MNPLISICIPTYKQVSSFSKLLQSIAEQTFIDFEVIVSDDSPDNAIEEVINSAKCNFKLKYFRNSPAKGSPGNWNYVISKASGTWIKLMHHDDCFEHSYSLQHFVDAINNQPEKKFFFCGTMIFDTQKDEKYRYSPTKSRIDNVFEKPAELFHANVIGAPSATIIHKDVKEVYDENLIWLVDVELYFRLICNYGVVRIEEALISTTAEGPNQLTNTLKDNKVIEIKEFFYCYNKLSPILNFENRSILRQRILFLLQHYKVESTDEIRDSGFKGKIPFFVKIYCFLSKFNNSIARKILGKWLQFQLS